MKILIACEFSGVVRNAFLAKGHDAYSCDLLDTEQEPVCQHFRDNVIILLGIKWDMMIAHPPCTYLAVSGNRWMKERPERHGNRENALNFVRKLMNADIPKICIENPKSVISSRIRKPDQVLHPWQFGHPEKKETHLWLKGLPPLVPTNDVRHLMEGKSAKDIGRVHYAAPGPERWRERSRTFEGIAAAMAAQWG